MKKLVIFGIRDFADIAYEYFSFDSDFEVVAFTVNRIYMTDITKFGLPVIPFEDINLHLNPRDHYFFAAITYSKMNDDRSAVLAEALKLGFSPASYVSSNAFVWRNVQLGIHNFLFENNVCQPFSRLGDNVILWSGNHIGHHSVIGNNVFVSSHVVISGGVTIGNNCFLGVNSTISNGVFIGDNCWINAHSFVGSDVSAHTFVSDKESARKELEYERLEMSLKRKSRKS